MLGRTIGGGGSGITILSDGTVYNPGRPAPGSNVGLGYDKPMPKQVGSLGEGGGRPIGGGGSGITTLQDGTIYNPGRPIPTPEQGGLTLAGMAQQPMQNPFGGGLGSLNQQPLNQQLLNQQPFGGGLSSFNQQPQQMDGGLKGLLDSYIGNYINNYFMNALR
jgi:hypothetical protein